MNEHQIRLGPGTFRRLGSDESIPVTGGTLTVHGDEWDQLQASMQQLIDGFRAMTVTLTAAVQPSIERLVHVLFGVPDQVRDRVREAAGIPESDVRYWQGFTVVLWNRRRVDLTPWLEQLADGYR